MNLPRSHAEAYQPYRINSKLKRVLVLADLHIPYHHCTSIKSAVNSDSYDCIILGGDVVDFYQLSRFVKDPRKRSFVNEISDTKAFLKSLRNRHRNAKIVWLQGNHENRLNIYLQTHSPELLGLDFLSMKNLFGLENLKIDYTDKPILYRDYLILHGSELSGKCSPQNPARSAYQKTLVPTILGHHHRADQHTAVDWQGRRIDLACGWVLVRATPLVLHDK